MRISPGNRFARWAGVCLLALAVPTAARADATKTTPPMTGATNATGGAGGLGAFTLPTLTADEQAQLLSDAMTVAELIFGFLGATPTEEELTAAAEEFYHLLLFLTLLQKFGEMFAPNAP